ncbi:MAG: Holliday junction resolvase RuvX [Caulobacteraceae bacterium]
MAVLDLADLASALAAGSAVLGLDLGEKRIGVAISDASRLIASPLRPLRRTKFTDDAAHLFELMAARGAGALVIGLPVNMDGREGPRSQSARAFARNLLRLRDLPIALWDERLSTAAVERVLRDEADLSRKRRGALLDSAAAAWILQGALDWLRRHHSNL